VFPLDSWLSQPSEASLSRHRPAEAGLRHLDSIRHHVRRSTKQLAIMSCNACFFFVNPHIM
jgi:hypothetical protein